MAERSWTDTQLHAGFALFSMVQATGRCSGIHPFSVLTAFIGCVNHLAGILDIEGSVRLFQENLCDKMGYDYGKIMAGVSEERCRSTEL